MASAYTQLKLVSYGDDFKIITATMLRQKAKAVHRQRSVAKSRVIAKRKPSRPKTPSLHLVVAARLRRALAQRLADESGLPRNVVEDILDGKSGKLYMKQLEKLANVLELDFSKLVKRPSSEDA